MSCLQWAHIFYLFIIIIYYFTFKKTKIIIKPYLNKIKDQTYSIIKYDFQTSAENIYYYQILSIFRACALFSTKKMVNCIFQLWFYAFSKETQWIIASYVSYKQGFMLSRTMNLIIRLFFFSNSIASKYSSLLASHFHFTITYIFFYCRKLLSLS